MAQKSRADLKTENTTAHTPIVQAENQKTLHDNELDSYVNITDDTDLIGGGKTYNPSRSYGIGTIVAYDDGGGIKTYTNNKVTTGTWKPADWDVTLGEVEEAPVDGTRYVRQDAGWVEDAQLIPTAVFSPLSTPPAHTEAQFYYDDNEKEFVAHNDIAAFSLNIGGEVAHHVINQTGSTLPDGTVVRIIGSIGGVPLVQKAQANTLANAITDGLLTTEIPNGGTGMMTTHGYINGIDLSSYSVGDTLYLSQDNAGEFTNAVQKITVPVGKVISNVVDGRILTSRKGIQENLAFGQSISDGSRIQTFTTTPQKLEAFTTVANTERGVTITQVDGGGGNYTAAMSPATAGSTGIYTASVSVSLTAPTNNKIILELYINGVGTNVKGIIDLSNSNTSSGNVSFDGITTEISEVSTVEIYGYTNTGTNTATFDSAIFNIRRLGI
jgi:hypothetical protein